MSMYASKGLDVARDEYATHHSTLSVSHSVSDAKLNGEFFLFESVHKVARKSTILLFNYFIARSVQLPDDLCISSQLHPERTSFTSSCAQDSLLAISPNGRYKLLFGTR